MSRFRPIALFLALSLFAFVLGACKSHKILPELHTALVGTWKGEQSGAYLTIYSDGRFVLERALGVQEGTRILGKVQRGRDMLKFFNYSPSASCPGQDGTYRFVRVDDTLALEVVEEECPERLAQLDKSWTLYRRTPQPIGN